MSVSENTLESLNHHWAVASIGAEELRRVENLICERLANWTVGEQIKFSFEESSDDELFLRRVELAFEVAAIEGLDEMSRPADENTLLREQAVVASNRAFEILHLFPIPLEIHERLYFVLQLSAVSYCGDRWSDLRRWYKESQAELKNPECSWCTVGEKVAQ